MKNGVLPVFLALVFVIFIGILVATYVVARQVDPVILDEHGQPRNPATQVRP